MIVSFFSPETDYKESANDQVWWCISILPALRKPRQEGCKLGARLGYIARLCQKKKRKEGRMCK
jgi:hypothetical protein